MRRLGFTLAEVVMVTVALGILAAIAIPNYTKAIERTHYQEAESLLLTIYAGERGYFFTNNAYYTPGDWRNIYMDDPNLGSIRVSFSVSAPGATFTATATRTSGPCLNRTLTIDQDRTFGGNWPSTGAC